MNRSPGDLPNVVRMHPVLLSLAWRVWQAREPVQEYVSTSRDFVAFFNQIRRNRISLGEGLFVPTWPAETKFKRIEKISKPNIRPEAAGAQTLKYSSNNRRGSNEEKQKDNPKEGKEGRKKYSTGYLYLRAANMGHYFASAIGPHRMRTLIMYQCDLQRKLTFEEN